MFLWALALRYFSLGKKAPSDDNSLKNGDIKLKSTIALISVILLASLLTPV